MKAYLLARVSTDDQKDALPAQKYRLLDYAKERQYDFELFEIKESAYKGNRDNFSKVIDKITSYEGQSIVVFDKIDRYTRDSSSEQVRSLQKLLKAGRIELHFPSDNLYIHQNSPATDLLRLGMGIVVAQYYSDTISDNVGRRFEQKLRDGEWIGKAPVGYLNMDKSDGKKWVIIDPLKAEAVQKAFEYYASGNSSLREICKMWLREYGISANSSKVDITLKNPFYYGEMRVKGKLYPHKYERLITRDLFMQAEQVRNGYKVKPHRWGGLPYDYRGLIHCSECGCRITFEKKKGKYIYGHCTQYRVKHNAKYVNEESITSQLAKIFEMIHIPDPDYQRISEALKASRDNNLSLKADRKRTLDVEISKYRNRIDKIYEDYLDNKISEDLHTRKSEEYKEILQKLENRRSTFELSVNDEYGTVTHLLRLVNKAPKLFKNAKQERKRSLVNLVLSNLVLKDKQLGWELKEPFKMMALCKENANWLRGRGSNSRPIG